MIWTPLPLLAVVALLVLSAPAFARAGGEVEAKLPSGMVVGASYHPGRKQLPAVLILHGFLQTRDFPTVASTMDALASGGYTVLAPTLSLGVSRRNKSLPCEALHLHTLEEDAEEIAFWVRWLMSKGHSRITLIGHSYGNLQLLAYLGRNPSPVVKQLLMISLTDVEAKQSAAQRARFAQALRERVARGDTRLAEIEFGHCKKYVSPPASLLSYMSISRQRILDAVAQSPVPARVIMGSLDDRMGVGWVEHLQGRGIAVSVIPGASHFFDNQFEFDLHEVVLQTVTGR
ncbi:MAG: alpha/beta hydrolase family protein [Thiobacillus sp.]|uniref:alpha/beta hydrolase n=1 Tax=Thiobacillus sp. TaxID=924 RepID=UPI0027326E11|nr:alpha/beta hydrolase family protein [Thiobacillus sp.]MDP3584161.1 alpha/beta hydrolase family protein [Thiobacillus sp.]